MLQLRREVAELGQLIKACGYTGDLARCRQVHEQVLWSCQAEPESGVRLLNLLIDMYAKCSSIESAVAAFQSIERPSRHSWNCLLVAYIRCRCLAEAKATFYHGMPQRCVISWNAMLSAYANAGRVGSSGELFGKMPATSIASWNAMLSGSVHNGYCVDRARAAFFDRAPERNTVGCSILVAAYAARGDLRSARCVFDRMPEWDIVSSTAMVQAYAGAGRLEQATKEFQAMPQRNLVSWNALVAVHAHHGDTAAARAAFHRMPCHDVLSWSTLVLACARGGDGDARLVFDAMPQRDIVSWTGMMQALAEAEAVDEARAAFCRMPQHSTVAANVAMQSYVRRGELGEAVRLFQAMPSRSPVTWNAMVSGYGQAGLMDQARATFDATPIRDTVSWNALATAYYQCGRLGMVEATFSRMPSRGILSWTVMVQAYASGGAVEEARECFGAMPQRSVLAWNTMLLAFSGSTSMAVEVFQRMPQRTAATWNAMMAASHGDAAATSALLAAAPETNAVSWTIVVSAYAREGKLAEAQMVFERSVRWLQDPVAWSAMIAALGKNGMGGRALETLSAMAAEGVAPAGVTFISLLTGLSHAGELRRARDAFITMVGDYGLSPEVEHYHVLIDALGRMKRLAEAEELVTTMPFPADFVAWMSLLAAARAVGDKERAARAAKHVLQLNSEGSSAPYQLLSDLWQEETELKAVSA